MAEDCSRRLHIHILRSVSYTQTGRLCGEERLARLKVAKVWHNDGLDGMSDLE